GILLPVYAPATSACPTRWGRTADSTAWIAAAFLRVVFSPALNTGQSGQPGFHTRIDDATVRLCWIIASFADAGILAAFPVRDIARHAAGLPMRLGRMYS